MVRDAGKGGGLGASLAAVALGLVAFAAGLPGLAEVGVTWDEPNYFASVERIQAWTARVAGGEWREAMRPGSIRAAWDADRYFNPHPPFYKIGMAATEAAFGGMTADPTGYRLFSLACFALLVAFVTGATGRLAGATAGAAAGVALILMPRVFGHAHVAATDMPLTLSWFAATVAWFFFVRDGGNRWLVAGAVALGLGMATKFTAFLLPVPLAAWMLVAARSRRSVLALTAGVGLALLVAIAVNPAAWPDPLAYQVRLFEESLGREATVPISTFYDHRSYTFVVPWDHAIVMTIVTLPVPTLALAALGALSAPRGARVLRGFLGLCLAQVMFWWALLALPGSPNHDGVRLWLPMFPFVAVVAGAGFDVLSRAVRTRFRGAAATAGVALLATLFAYPPALATIRTAPYYLSYYGETIGGLAGADRQGMEVTYWFDAFTAAFRTRAETTLPDSAIVVAHPNHEYYEQLQAIGLLRPDLRFVADPPGDYLLLLARKAMFDPRWTAVYRSAPPLLAAEYDGVELVGLYAWNEPTTPAADTVESDP